MKNLLFLLPTLLVVSSIFGQQQILTISEPSQGEHALFDTLQLTLSSETGAEFRFVHPEFGNAFWSQEHLVEAIIDRYELDQSSSDFAIVSSVGDFYKRHRLHDNYGLIGGPSDNPSQPLSEVDLYSIQCGNYAQKTVSVVNLIVDRLDIDTIGSRSVSLDGHQIMEYWDDDHGKFVYLDSDPGTSVFVPRDNGELVSFDEIVVNPEILFDTSGSVWISEIDQINEPSPRDDYYDFMEPIIGTVTYYPFNYLETNRDMLYKLPAGVHLVFDQVLNSTYINVTNMDSTTMALCTEDLIQEEIGPECLEIIIEHLQNELGVTAQMALDIFNDSLVKIKTSDTTYATVELLDTWYFSVTLPSGYYDETNILLPNLMRSITPSVSGIPFTVNGTSYTEDYHPQMYWPAGTSEEGNPPEIDPPTIQSGLVCEIPPEIDSVTFTFYFNYKMFEFWKESWDIVIEGGDLSFEFSHSGESDIASDISEHVENVVSLYPNPSEGTFTLSVGDKTISTYRMFDMLGQEVFETSTPGVYFINFQYRGQLFVERLLVQ